MTFFGANLLSAVATVVLAVFAVVTAVYARKAFIKQSQEVAAIERQVADGQELTRQQAELLKVQTEHLELLRGQVEDQRAATARQGEVLELQAADLRESRDERRRAAGERHRAQAARVLITEKRHPWNDVAMNGGHHSIAVTVTNASEETISEAQLRWHLNGQPHSAPKAEMIGALLPGTHATRSATYPRDADLAACGAAVEFRDAAGTWWQRRPDGYLAEPK